MIAPEDRVLDWRPKWDDRSDLHRFLLVPMCRTLASHPSVMRKKTVFLDQGAEGACTGFGEEHVRAFTPAPKFTTNEIAQQVYIRAKIEDEYPGEDYEGSSVNGAMRAARYFGYIRRWLWAKTLEEGRHGLSYHGAGEMGSYWYSGMWNPDERGFLDVSGSRVGGHAYAIGGYRFFGYRRAYRMENTWGPDWGDHGGAWIWEDQFEGLLNDGGEFAFPSKVRSL